MRKKKTTDRLVQKNLTMPLRCAEALEAHAERTKKPQQTIVVEALDEYLERHGGEEAQREA